METSPKAREETIMDENEYFVVVVYEGRIGFPSICYAFSKTPFITSSKESAKDLATFLNNQFPQNRYEVKELT